MNTFSMIKWFARRLNILDRIGQTSQWRKNLKKFKEWKNAVYISAQKRPLMPRIPRPKTRFPKRLLRTRLQPVTIQLNQTAQQQNNIDSKRDNQVTKQENELPSVQEQPLMPEIPAMQERPVKSESTENPASAESITCTECSAVIVDKTSYITHIYTQHFAIRKELIAQLNDEETINCLRCQAVLKNRDTYRGHCRTKHFSERDFLQGLKCILCSHKAKDRKEWQKHNMTAHVNRQQDEKLKQEKDCDKKQEENQSKTENVVVKSETPHPPEMKAKAQKTVQKSASASASDTEESDDNIRLKPIPNGPIADKESDYKPDSSGRYPCPYCTSMLASRRTIQNHIHLMHEQDPQKCLNWQKIFQNTWKARDHIKQRHRKQYEKQNGDYSNLMARTFGKKITN